MAYEVIGVDAFIRSTLVADSALAAIVGTRVYEGMAPEVDPDSQTGARPAYPLIVWNLQSDRNVIGARAKRIMTFPLINIRVIGEGQGYAALQGAVDRIDALMDNVPLTSVSFGGDTFTVAGSWREQQYRPPPEVAEGIQYRTIGGLYRFVAY